MRSWSTLLQTPFTYIVVSAGGSTEFPGYLLTGGVLSQTETIASFFLNPAMLSILRPRRLDLIHLVLCLLSDIGLRIGHPIAQCWVLVQYLRQVLQWQYYHVDSTTPMAEGAARVASAQHTRYTHTPHNIVTNWDGNPSKYAAPRESGKHRRYSGGGSRPSARYRYVAFTTYDSRYLGLSGHFMSHQAPRPLFLVHLFLMYRSNAFEAKRKSAHC